MPGPDISPLLAKLGGAGYGGALRRRLLQLAEETGDLAYAGRLREVAEGARPLRTLAMDPAWQQQFRRQLSPDRDAPQFDAEQWEALEHGAEEARRTIPAMLTDPGAVASLAREAQCRAERASRIVREDQLNNWSYVPPASEDPGRTLQ